MFRLSKTHAIPVVLFPHVKLQLSLWLHFILAQPICWLQNSSHVKESTYGADI